MQYTNPTTLSFVKGDVHIFTCLRKPVQVELIPGKYKIECWGAQGGNGLGHGGYDGYIAGELSIEQNLIINIYVGGKGENAPMSSWTSYQAKGGYNGGGHAKCRWSMWTNCGAGGGASDVRFEGQGLEHRIIVAGGGGGSNKNHWQGKPFKGGAGGGLQGEQGITEGGIPIPPGTQTSGYSLG